SSWEEIRSLPIFRDCVSTWRYRDSRAATPTVKRSATELLGSEACNNGGSCISHGQSRVAVRSCVTLCRNFAAECGLVDVVDESAVAVDLHHREPLAVRGFEVRVAADVDFLQLERQLGVDAGDDVPRSLAEVATGGVVQPNELHGSCSRRVVFNPPRGSDPRWRLKRTCPLR